MTGHPAWAAALAIAAAGAYAVASVVQHRAVRSTAPRRALDPRLLLLMLTDRLWLTGSTADVVGIGLNALALSLGPLALVEPVVAGGILIAVLLDCLLDRRALGRPALLGVLTGTAGLAVFVLTAAPSGSTNDPNRSALAIALGCCLVSVALCLLSSTVTDRVWRGCVLGLAAGIAYAGSSSLVKVCSGLLAAGVGAVLLDWPLYALVAISGLGLVLNQSAFQSRPLQPALVSMTLATPSASVLIGVLAFHEHLAHTWPRMLTALLAAAIMGLGVLLSSRSEEPGQRRRPERLAARARQAVSPSSGLLR